MNDGEEIDWNKVFKDVKLPEELQFSGDELQPNYVPMNTVEDIKAGKDVNEKFEDEINVNENSDDIFDSEEFD